MAVVSKPLIRFLTAGAALTTLATLAAFACGGSGSDGSVEQGSSPEPRQAEATEQAGPPMTFTSYENRAFSYASQR